MSGVIEGGWEFVRLAYGVTAVVLVTYTLSLFARHRNAGGRGRKEGREL